MMSTENELTMNDTFLIIDKNNLQSNENFILSYRKNLLKLLKTKSDDFSEFNDSDLDDSRKFREIVGIADNNEYWIYQLTRL